MTDRELLEYAAKAAGYTTIQYQNLKDSSLDIRYDADVLSKIIHDLNMQFKKMNLKSKVPYANIPVNGPAKFLRDGST